MIADYNGTFPVVRLGGYTLMAEIFGDDITLID